MQISILTLFPELYGEFLQTSLIGRAQGRGLVKFDLQSFFQFCEPKQRIDSPTYGHQAGMLLKPDIVATAIDQQEQRYGQAFKIFLSPKGQKLDQALSRQLAVKLQSQSHLLFVAARYEGIDARVEQVYADLELSIGDYVLMGGDLPAMVTIEALLRYLPGLVGKAESVAVESFSGPLVEHPEYTAPAVWRGLAVPEVLRTGNHRAIQEWQLKQAAERTVKQHFTWLRGSSLTLAEQQLVSQYIPPHYVVLMHDQVLLKAGTVGTSSVTSLDLHDIARSARTYNIKNYYIVTPLVDQRQIVQTLLDFWHSTSGIQHNIHRHWAVSRIKLKASLDEVLQDIYAQEQQAPLLISTSAKAANQGVGADFRSLAQPNGIRHSPGAQSQIIAHENTTASTKAQPITYQDQHRVWATGAPVLLLFGTAHGLSPALVAQSDFLLAPVAGFSDFNHLSVRSAAAIVLDRWLGLQPREAAAGPL